MITDVLLIIWLFAVMIPILFLSDYDSDKKVIIRSWILWAVLSLVWIVPIFTGVKVKNNEGQYRGYVVAVERNGAIFKGWNVYLKSELESSNEDIACINREDLGLIQRLKKAQETKENMILVYTGVWRYAIGECPKSHWMIVGTQENN